MENFLISKKLHLDIMDVRNILDIVRMNEKKLQLQYNLELIS